MVAVRVFTPEDRLADIFSGPGGLTAEELIKRADDRISALAPNLRTFVAEKLADIERIVQEPEEVIFAECIALGDAALAICEVAGAAGMAPLGEAARGISAMVDALVVKGVWHTEALKLHIDALLMFAAQPALASPEVRKILARLKAMRDGIGVPE